MSLELDPLPPEVLRQLNSLRPPPAPPGLAAGLLAGIHAAAAVARPPSWLARVPLWVPAVTLGLGAAAGAGFQSWRAAAVDVEAPPPLARELAGPVVTDAGPSASPELAPAPVEPARPRKPGRPLLATGVADAGPSSPPEEDRLREERVLIDAARASIGRSPEEGLRSIAQHQREFPSGQLAEEREALAVQLLLTLRRFDDARVRFEAFERAFPGSPLRGVLASSFGKLDAGTRSLGPETENRPQ